MQIFSKTDIGKARHTNQDTFKNISLEGGAELCIVCDGMGGANAGNIASRMAADIIIDYISRSYSTELKPASIKNMIESAIESANAEVAAAAEKSDELIGMGTTVVLALLTDDTAYIAHVGDSRAYELSGGELHQLTTDHSMIQSLIEQGHLSPEEARFHPKRNIITRAVGISQGVVSDFLELPLCGQKLLLCTDGLSGFVQSDSIAQVLENFEPQSIPEELINRANAAGGGDNITVTVILV